MIDALELSVPAMIRPIPDVWDRLDFKELRKGPYKFQADCRENLHFFVRYGHRHPVKSEKRHVRLIYEGVRFISADDIVARIQRLFDISVKDVHRFKVVRLDFAANVSPPVEWFRQHFYVKGKQESTEYLCVQKTTRKTTTITFGKRPDRYSIYNKVKEVIDKGRPLLHSGTGTGEDPPIVTRVERQCTGIGVPTNLRTLGTFFENIANFDPYKKVVFMKGGTAPNTGLWTAQRWLMNLGVQAAVFQYGWIGARRED